MTKKIVLIGFMASLLLVSLIAYSLPAFAKPVDLPDPAKATVAPLKVRIIEHEGLTAVMKPYYTSLDSPANHETNDGFDGTGLLIIARTDFAGFVGCRLRLLDCVS